MINPSNIYEERTRHVKEKNFTCSNLFQLRSLFRELHHTLLVLLSHIHRGSLKA